MNLHVPEEYGGMGLGTLTGCMIAETFGYGCTGKIVNLIRGHDFVLKIQFPKGCSSKNDLCLNSYITEMLALYLL